MLMVIMVRFKNHTGSFNCEQNFKVERWLLLVEQTSVEIGV
jgi:hypothetical protein